MQQTDWLWFLLLLSLVYYGAACAGTFEITLDDRLLETPEQAADCSGTQGVTTAGAALCVDGQRYRVRGVNYGPQHEESCATTPYYEAVAFDDLLPSEHGDAQAIADAGLNTIRVYSPISKAISTSDCTDGACWLDTRHLDELGRRGIRLIITISSVWDFRKGLHVGAAERYQAHPTVIALQVGNEQNHNAFYEWNNRSATELVAMSNAWIAEIRAAGWGKPVILGWGHPQEHHRESLRASHADIIAYQLYERLSFRTSNGESVFDWHRSTFRGERPGLITEYGADAMNGDAEDETAQAFAVGNLLGLVEADADRKDGIAGGLIFSWADNWGKADGDACVHDRTGKPGGSAGPHPDGIYHEEWWGLVRRDRAPRSAYHKVRDVLR